MHTVHSRPSLGRRIRGTFLAWLVLGAVIGATGGTGSPGAIVSGTIAGMIVLSVPGLLLAVLGGDVKGTLVGAAGGLLACLLLGLDPGSSIHPLTMRFVVLVGALTGATCPLYLRALSWTHKTIVRTGNQLMSSLLIQARATETADKPRRAYPAALATTVRGRVDPALQAPGIGSS
jgi:hypothetical protein